MCFFGLCFCLSSNTRHSSPVCVPSGVSSRRVGAPELRERVCPRPVLDASLGSRCGRALGDEPRSERVGAPGIGFLTRGRTEPLAVFRTLRAKAPRGCGGVCRRHLRESLPGGGPRWLSARSLVLAWAPAQPRSEPRSQAASSKHWVTPSLGKNPRLPRRVRPRRLVCGRRSSPPSRLRAGDVGAEPQGCPLSPL